MRKYRTRASIEDANEINLTPMIDVMFIMLVFFLVTASFIKESGIAVERPTAETATVHENAAIVVAIDVADEVWINHRRVDIRAVRIHVDRLHRESPRSAVIIHADKRSSNGVFVAVLDQVHLAGIKDVAIAADLGS